MGRAENARAVDSLNAKRGAFSVISKLTGRANRLPRDSDLIALAAAVGFLVSRLKIIGWFVISRSRESA